MLHLRCRFVTKYFFLWLLFSLVANFTWAQSETATVSGQVVDPSGLNVTGAQVKLVDIDRDTSTIVTTNNIGLYTFSSVKPGRYRMEVSAAGFRLVNVTGITANVQDHLEQNFKLVVGSISESMTVTADAYNVNTTDATVSTVVDRNFAENLPMNGRSFQALIELTPGVVLTSSNTSDSGQFSVNGQRAASNYWTVDGVSANIGIGINGAGTPGNGLGGTLGSFSAQGGTNSLVSVDAMQEFRIQTSTYAPEFGRSPGGQISIVTRSGSNQFHGTAFDYLRNSVFDANDWFAGQQGLPKPGERQNDFGGVLGGPIIKDRTFFFFSYEGQRLRLPKVALTSVPDLNARQTAVPALQPFLNAFPLPSPNTADDVAEGIGEFNASYSNRSTLNAYSLRIDHSLRSNLSLFGRYNNSPSEIGQRGPGESPLSTISSIRISTQTATVGTAWLLSPNISIDSRFNYSRVSAFGNDQQDNFGGAVPLAALPFPGSFTSQDGSFLFGISSLGQGSQQTVGLINRNLQRQINIVNSLFLQKGSHSLKFGVDFRRLTPFFDPPSYIQDALFADVPSAEKGILSYSLVAGTGTSPTFLFRNLGLYVQDTWRIVSRLTVTYGFRWDVDFVPQSLSGPSFPAVTGFNLNNLSNLALGPPGTPPYSTTYGNLAPRFGIAYRLLQSQDWQTVLRGGFGVFYDLASSEAGNSIETVSYPFGNEFIGGGTFPLASTSPPPIVTPSPNNPGVLFAFNPKLKLPYTLQWNLALEQTLGQKQAISVSYIGAAGRRLLQTATAFQPNPSFLEAQLVTNAATSDYSASQVQFQRRLEHGLQALASYTWSHSIDTASAGSTAVGSNLLSSTFEAGNRGPSDFDIRNTFSAGVTYDIPAPRVNSFARAILDGWSTEDFFLARSSPPLSVLDFAFYEFENGFSAAVWPDVVPGQPFFLYGTQCANVLEPLEPNGEGHFACPGGKGLNPAAFTDPPVNANGIPLRQGSLGRNALRAFGTTQWDFAIHRDFSIHESLKLQFRAEMFNVLNHPNFGPPNNDFLSPQSGGPVPLFGLASQMLNNSLNSANQGGGGFSALYQIGGPRSIQFALRLSF
jgi:Carboxypeptidase regulatory-like domain/TonB dependent receptor